MFTYFLKGLFCWYLAMIHKKGNILGAEMFPIYLLYEDLTIDTKSQAYRLRLLEGGWLDMESPVCVFSCLSKYLGTRYHFGKTLAKS